MVTFLLCTFGYMDFMIILKWLKSWDPTKAPSIITVLIDMALKPTEVAFPLYGEDL